MLNKNLIICVDLFNSEITRFAGTGANQRQRDGLNHVIMYKSNLRKGRRNGCIGNGDTV